MSEACFEMVTKTNLHFDLYSYSFINCIHSIPKLGFFIVLAGFMLFLIVNRLHWVINNWRRRQFGGRIIRRELNENCFLWLNGEFLLCSIYTNRTDFRGVHMVFLIVTFSTDIAFLTIEFLCFIGMLLTIFCFFFCFS